MNQTQTDIFEPEIARLEKRVEHLSVCIGHGVGVTIFFLAFCGAALFVPGVLPSHNRADWEAGVVVFFLGVVLLALLTLGIWLLRRRVWSNLCSLRAMAQAGEEEGVWPPMPRKPLVE